MAKEANITVLALKPGQPIEKVTIENELQPLKDLLDDGWLEMVRLSTPILGELVMVVDEEGMLKELEPSVAWEGGYLYGNVIFVGANSSEGEFTSLSEDQQKYVKEWIVGRQIFKK